MAPKIAFCLALLSFLYIENANSFSFRLQHRCSDLEGSSKRGGMSSEHLERLRSHDTKRHARNLAGAASFPLGGTADPNVAGLYFTELDVGTPSSRYYAQVDTGSDLLWLNCASCKTCPTSTKLGVPLRFYDPDSSTTSQKLTCGEQLCGLASSNCETGQDCRYELVYGDGSSASGYLVQDNLEFLLPTENRSLDMDHVPVNFGCALFESGGLHQQQQALDGILGLGQSNVSIIQQLAFQGKVPQVFAHCLEGERSGGGILVIGDVLEPELSFTPLLTNQLHYSVNLKSIEVNGQSLKIEPSFDATGESQGTIFDSGTTLSYIAEPAYQLLLQQITSGPSTLISPPWEDLTCVYSDGSLDDSFPSITFIFEGGASMTVMPHDYFIRVRALSDRDNVFCIGFQNPTRSSLDYTILGDLVLKNKLVVYDLEKRQIGWVDYNCSSNLTVASSIGQPRQVFASSLVNFSSDSEILKAGSGFVFLLLLYTVMKA